MPEEMVAYTRTLDLSDSTEACTVLKAKNYSRPS
ncbi:uncharacterized protein ANIA_11490 [Aspergillus nidulans FGSC A4]|uniref:Uncharacterized protein n=1 Tax=Emericella nidulans (strain FGSC A4 / ATCC 38163 / CBS 112.46 / NRRL 194 / M139) TaxID=227321 RepID=C8VFC7_EMENI|nr:hypothetical protein [Aspergillus nidulans FGSC A4]CBF81164.1 TPA: hypothetical protein ANIA_11490 [Aspergillus nidulans FGSC A4]